MDATNVHNAALSSSKMRMSVNENPGDASVSESIADSSLFTDTEAQFGVKFGDNDNRLDPGLDTDDDELGQPAGPSRFQIVSVATVGQHRSVGSFLDYSNTVGVDSPVALDLDESIVSYSHSDKLPQQQQPQTETEQKESTPTSRTTTTSSTSTTQKLIDWYQQSPMRIKVVLWLVVFLGFVVCALAIVGVIVATLKDDGLGLRDDNEGKSTDNDFEFVTPPSSSPKCEDCD